MGNVVERIGNIDIGLGKLKEGISFNNRFLGIEAAPKTFLHSSSLQYRDEFVIDGFTTSVQRLSCLGRRVRKEFARTEDLYKPNNDTELPGPGTYVVLNQGIMATGEPEMSGFPRVREGACGSALLLAMSGGANVIEKGVIAGFMYWSDLQSVYNNDTPPPLLCYCDTVDDLMEQGWKIAKAGEKRKLEE